MTTYYQVYVPGTPGDPGTPPKYQRTDQIGWGSGAVSIPIVSGDGGYQFTVTKASAGVVIGIADSYSGVGYTSIPHALYFSRGALTLMEFGKQVKSLGAYESADVFKILRVGTKVSILKNGIFVAGMPSMVSGDFYLAAATYMEGDSVVGAMKVAASPGGYSNGGDDTPGPTAIGELSALGMGNGAAAFGVSTIGPIWAEGHATGHATGDATLGPIMAIGGDHAVGGASVAIGPLASYAEGGLLYVPWGVGAGEIDGLASTGVMLTGEIGQGAASLGKILARASDRSMGEGIAYLDGVRAYGAEGLPMSPAVLVHGGNYKIDGRGSRATADGLDASLPALKLNAYFGSQWKLKSPKLKLQASGTVTTNWPFQLTGPALTLAGAGTVSGVIEFNLTYGGKPSVQVQFGAQAKLATKGGYALEGHGLVGSAGAGQLKLRGHYTLDAVGTVRELTVWSLTGPALTAAPTGQAWLVGPSLKLVAAGGEVVAATYEAYAINIATGAVSHYTNFSFDNVLRFGSRFIGVRADGLYELTGGTDNGDAIDAVIKTFRTDFSAPNKKRVPWVYLVGRSCHNMNLSVVADESPVFTYPALQTAAGNLTGMGTARAAVGKGVRGTYYEFTIANTDGSDFELDRVEAVVDITSRVL